MSDEIRYTVGQKTDKLRPREVSLFRRVFLSRVEHGASVEAAERQALHACKLWERHGAFGEDREKDENSGDEAKFRDGFDALADYHADPEAVPATEVSVIAGLYRTGDLSLAEFRKKLGLDLDDV